MWRVGLTGSNACITIADVSWKSTPWKLFLENLFISLVFLKFHTFFCFIRKKLNIKVSNRIGIEFHLLNFTVTLMHHVCRFHGGVWDHQQWFYFEMSTTIKSPQPKWLERLRHLFKLMKFTTHVSCEKYPKQQTIFNLLFPKKERIQKPVIRFDFLCTKFHSSDYYMCHNQPTNQTKDKTNCLFQFECQHFESKRKILMYFCVFY